LQATEALCHLRVTDIKNILQRLIFFVKMKLVSTWYIKRHNPNLVTGRLAGISEGAGVISKYFFLDHFSTSFLSQKR
jgi:hypothetical protein